MDWHRFKEAFSPNFVYKAITSHPTQVRVCVDPFCGSGTTAVVSQLLGISSTSIEVNPFLRDLAVAKTLNYHNEDIARLLNGMDEVEEWIVTKSPLTPLSWTPDSFVEPGFRGRFIFSRTQAEAIQSLLDYRDTITQSDLRRLMSVSIGASLIKNSNVVVNGKGRRYRKAWQASKQDPRKLISDVRNKILEITRDASLFPNRDQRNTEIVLGDCRSEQVEFPLFDVAVFSPPYPNSFDYTDIYNVELWVLGYIRSREGNIDLRKRTMRSHLQVSRQLDPPTTLSKTLKEVHADLSSVRANLWDTRIPEMISSYFCDTETVLRKLKSSKNVGGRIWMIVANSQYKGIEVNTPKIIEEIAKSLGYKEVQVELSRLLRNSPQQGGTNRLAESAIVIT